MEKYIHIRLNDEIVKFVFQKYISKQISFEQASKKLDLKKSRFFELLKQYKKDSAPFLLSIKEKVPNALIQGLKKSF